MYQNGVIDFIGPTASFPDNPPFDGAIDASRAIHESPHHPRVFTALDALINVGTNLCVFSSAATLLLLYKGGANAAAIGMYSALTAIYTGLAVMSEYNKWRPGRKSFAVKDKHNLYVQAGVQSLLLGDLIFSQGLPMLAQQAPYSAQNIMDMHIMGAVALGIISNCVMATGLVGEKKAIARPKTENIYPALIFLLVVASNTLSKGIFFDAAFYALASALPSHSIQRMPALALAGALGVAAYQLGDSSPVATTALIATAAFSLLPSISQTIYEATGKAATGTVRAFLRVGDWVTGRKTDISDASPVMQAFRRTGEKLLYIFKNELTLPILTIGSMAALQDSPDRLRTLLYGLMPISGLCLKRGGVAEACHYLVDTGHDLVEAWRGSQKPRRQTPQLSL